MDYSSSWINTSLDLNNINPHSHRPVHQQLPVKNMVENNFFSLEIMKKTCPKEESSGGSLVEELKRVSAENKKLTGMLTEMCENYNTLRNNLMEYMRNNPDHHHHHHHNKESTSSPSKKRKSADHHEISSSTNNNLMGVGIRGVNNSDSSTSSDNNEDQSCKKPMELETTCIKAKVSRVYFKQQSSDSSLIVKDGYQWRKYGQKVTRDNPSPRAYFKCSFAPSCTVKKKVQRSAEDPSLVVATYEGEHNHQMDSTNNRSTRNPIPPPSSSAPSTVTIDWTKSKCTNINESSSNNNPKMEVPQILVEQMATSLTKDLNFRAALAAAISGKMLHQN